jgi:hypothetical protein
VIKLGTKIQLGKIRMTITELPDLSEMKKRWMAGEDPLGDRPKKKKTKMEKRRIRKRYERLKNDS